MAEENSWKSREDEEEDEFDETVRTIDACHHYIQAHLLGL